MKKDVFGRVCLGITRCGVELLGWLVFLKLLQLAALISRRGIFCR
jgi:hypothetical protein